MVEGILGVGSEPDSTFTPSRNVSATFLKAAGCDSSDQVKSVLRDNAPALLRMVLEYDGPDMLSEFSRPDNGDWRLGMYLFSLRACA